MRWKAEPSNRALLEPTQRPSRVGHPALFYVRPILYEQLLEASSAAGTDAPTLDCEVTVLTTRVTASLARAEGVDGLLIQRACVPEARDCRAWGMPFVLTFHGGGDSQRLGNRLRGVPIVALRPSLARADRLSGWHGSRSTNRRGLRMPRDRFVLVRNAPISRLQF